jgi:hypothetical protein
MAAGFIKEVFHPEWLANPVLVRKKGGKWRMCVDYTGLNKACLKVPYPLPRDGNGYPRPDTRWVFTPLGYVCGLNILPMGLLLRKNLHPMGKRVLERSAFTHTR